MPMMWILFGFLAFLIVASALGMLFSKNAIYSALFLVLNFVIVAVLYLSLGAPFIAFTQITVYAGAIMVLFLFLIMLLGAERLNVAEAMRNFRIYAIGIALIFAGAGGFLAAWKAGSWDSLPEISPDFAGPKVIGTVLFSEYLLPFLIVSFILLIAAIGAIMLTRKELTSRVQKTLLEGEEENSGQ
jgi:NADH-quinone oxidoreductase subunit J